MLSELLQEIIVPVVCIPNMWTTIPEIACVIVMA
jgi:hypothetical protein